MPWVKPPESPQRSNVSACLPLNFPKLRVQ
jgi:hypothetical protein